MHNLSHPCHLGYTHGPLHRIGWWGWTRPWDTRICMSIPQSPPTFLFLGPPVSLAAGADMTKYHKFIYTTCKAQIEIQTQRTKVWILRWGGGVGWIRRLGLTYARLKIKYITDVNILYCARNSIQCSVQCLAIQSHPTLCSPKDYSLPGPLSMEFARQENWSGLPFPSPGDLDQPRDQIWVFCIGRHILYHWHHLKPTQCSVVA